ncbi:hypothetical protein ACJIZ3_024336 [Penstemon smallii]|uniref:Protein kinase domain-containing protein n=1 Tax=Penstemon smallii TaxID=265156 RepID=A0ABD3TSJ1_9LAMI
MKLHFFFTFLLFTSLFPLSSTTTTTAAITNDTAALSLFRSQTDLHGTLLTNWTTTTTSACTANWIGIKCTNNRVTAVSLPFLNLRGPIDALSSLDQLRFLDLRNNRLNSTLTPITQCTNLKLIYLSSNDFSGEIPPEISSLHRLLRLDLSNNNLNGPIPIQITKLSKLLTLHLQNNEISGKVPDFLDSLPKLKELNLSNNELYGTLPKSLISRYGANSFSGNQELCFNTHNCVNPSPSSSQTVPSNPSSLPSSSIPIIQEPSKDDHHKRLSNGAIVAIVVANSVLLLVIASFTVAYYCGKYSRGTSSIAGSEGGGKRRSSYSSEKRVYANNGGGGDSDGNRGPGRIPLDWTTRISIILGAARGLTRIHEEYASSRIPHGNVKSSNVLLDKNGIACISDFGMSLLLNPVHAIAKLGGYKAPEQVETKRLSQMADVYSFGVLLLEVLTGRAPSEHPSPTRSRPVEEEKSVDLPRWVQSVVRDEWTAEVFDQELLRYKNIEEELVSMLHVAMACVVPLPEKRPTMSEVVKIIEEIRVEQSPLGEDYDESRNSMSPSIGASTEDA